ncbi:amidohydrolase [Pseudomonas proteolytica]|uniref:amidohydrolase n=1 Tax=Pseudomonas proteolytica TaxID=219574 RepID=UPI0023E01D0D|nr:amidohydrolase [Pseudomonas proteolytica]MDF3162813.1 amidohydrolase [Pseudomonas proteolytica]
MKCIQLKENHPVKMPKKSITFQWAAIGMFVFSFPFSGLSAASIKAATQVADTVYFGGSILTMEGDSPTYAEAISVKDGKILSIGNKTDVLKDQGDHSRVVDLQGKVLLPGFIDAHGHAWTTGFQKLSANLLPPPDGGGRSIPAVVEALKSWQQKNAIAIDKVGWIVGFGYDDSQLAEQRHPTADDLDQVSTELPVVIIHQSAHLAVMNHKALEMSGISAQTANPSGGVIRRTNDGKTPDGVLEEMAFFAPIFKLLATFDPSVNEKIALAGADYYAQYGFTTAQEGRASKAQVETWQKLASQKKMKIDVAAYPDLQAEQAFMKTVSPSAKYDNHFRIAGVKLSLDGSPQGRTAWMTEPYKVPPPGQPVDYKGYPAIPKAEDREALVNQAFKRNWQVLAHCNGDAASDAFIDAVAKAEKSYGKGDRRTVMIHAQAVREDQLDKMKSLGIIPSFFGMQTFYWGDWHRDVTMGKERAFRWDPAASAIKRGMLFTEHHDAPVATPSAMMIVFASVNRTSRSGEVIGSDQRISPYLALKSITASAAYQYFEERRKGTLLPGKLADFVILDNDPTKVAPATIKDIQVLETIKEGETVYQAVEG